MVSTQRERKRLTASVRNCESEINKENLSCRLIIGPCHAEDLEIMCIPCLDDGDDTDTNYKDR